MTKYKSQLTSQLPGRLNNLVYVRRKGETHVRPYVSPPTPNSEKQLARQARFAEAMKLVNPFRELIAFTIGTDPRSFGKVLSATMKKEITAIGLSGYDLYSKIPLGSSDMRCPSNLKMEQTAPRQVTLSWRKPLNPSPSANDTVSLFIYDSQQNWKRFYPLLGKLTDGTITLDINDIAAPASCFVWAAFRSTHHRHTSDTWLWEKMLTLEP